jgi:hypothetical protein
MRSADLIYLDNMHDYIITAVRAISIVCVPDDSICYGGQGVTPTPRPSAGATPTPNPALTFGVGLDNDRECSDCCFTCVGGRTVPQINLRCP